MSRPALLIYRLVGISIETPALNALAAQLPALDEVQRARVASSLGLLDHVPTMAECVGVEEETCGGWMESQLEARAKSEGAKSDAAKWVGDLLAPMTSDGKRVDGGPIRTAEEARKLIAGYRARMKELAKLCELPSAQFQPESAKFFAQLKEKSADNVLASMVIPAIDKARAGAEAARVRLALLRVALDVQAKGESALPGKLATYRKTEGGFELTSVEQFDGKPVVLTVGR